MIVKFLAAALMTLMLSCPAAATVLYKITVTGGYNFSITAPKSPAAVSDFGYGPSGFGFSDVSGVFEGVDTSMYVTFLVDEDGVAVRELDQTAVWQGFSETNGQMFTGPTSDPTFKLGIYPLVRAMPFGSGYTGTAVLTISALPEPATWASLLFGIGGIGALQRWRRAARRPVTA
jgi:hypothetical protein